MTPDLIEKIAAAIEDQIASDNNFCEDLATAALSVVLDEIGEECAQVASDAWWNHETDETPVLIRARIAEMKRDLSQPT